MVDTRARVESIMCREVSEVLIAGTNLVTWLGISGHGLYYGPVTICILRNQEVTRHQKVFTRS